MNRRTFLSRIGITAAPLAGAAVGYETAAGSTVRAVATGNKNIPNVKVTSQENKTYQFYDDLVKQKIVLVNFFYANCSGICPRLTSALVKVQKALGERVGRDVFIYSISLKPEEDTPKHLAHYAGMHGIKPGSGWLFLRAARSDMELLRERLGFKDSDPVLDADINQHTGLLRFGNDKYDRWSAYPLMGNVQTIAQLVREMDPSTPKGSIY
jgi:protein SCO1/2